jgi:beta-lactamase regulating signal transducer with metallopeptidase domain/uncharacterized GH25 family protein
MFEGLSSDSAAGFWFQLFARASLHAFVVLAIVALFWFCLRRRISHAFAHGLFLLVPVKFALVIVFGLLSVQLSVDIPITPSTRPVNFELQGQNGQFILEPKSTLPGFDEPGHDTIEFVPAGPSFERIDLSDATPVSNSVVSKHTWSLSSDFLTVHHVEYRKPSILMLAMIIWGICCITLTVRFLIQTIRMHRRIGIASGGDSARLAGIMADLADQIGLRRVPRIVTTSAVASPAVFGLIRPTLLIPEGFESDFDECEMRWAIAHELAHSKRRDLWAVALERAVGLAGFFHPALWISRRATANFREQACDDFACRVTGLPPRGCAETFLKILVWADHRSAIKVGSPLLLGLNPGYPAIRRRIENMTDSKMRLHMPRCILRIVPLLTIVALLPVTPRFVAADALKTGSAEELQGNVQRDDREPSFKIRMIDAVTGKPVTNARVKYSTDRFYDETKPDEHGKANIPFVPTLDGLISIRILAESYVDYVFRRNPTDDPDYPPVSPLIVKLRPGMTVSGKVVDESGKPVVGAVVRVNYRTRDLPGNESKNYCDLVRTDIDGRWKTTGVDPEAVQIYPSVLHPEFPVQWGMNEHDPRGRVEAPFESLKSGSHVFVMKRDNYIIGRVVDSEGKPVAGASVRYSDWPMMLGDPPLMTDNDGEFRIGRSAETPYKLRVYVRKPGQGVCLRAIEAGDVNSTVTFRLTPARTIRGRVTDTEGNAMPATRIFDYTEPIPGISPQSRRLTRPDGRFEMTDLPSDFVKLLFMKSGFQPNYVKIDASRTDEIDVVMTRQVSVDVSVTDAESGQPVTDFEMMTIVSAATSEDTSPISGRHVDGRSRFVASPMRDNDAIERNRFRLSIEAIGYERYHSDWIAVDALPKSIPIALKRSAQSRKIEGQVLRPDGIPAANASLGYFTPKGVWPRYAPGIRNDSVRDMYVYLAENSQKCRTNVIRTDDHGKFHISADFEKVGWVVSHQSGVFVSASAMLIGQEPVTIRLNSYPQVRGTVTYEGKPMPNAHFWFELSGDQIIYDQQQVGKTDAGGNFEIRKLIPGKLSLKFSRDRKGGQSKIHPNSFPVAANDQLNVQVSIDEFGFRQRVFDASGKLIANDSSGELAANFTVYGRATDAVTGKALNRTFAYLLSGLPGDDVKARVPWYPDAEGRFKAKFGSSNSGIKAYEVDPFLVVLSPGYKPFVSSRPIVRAHGPVRVDVALNPDSPKAPSIVRGKIVRADGSPAKRARIGVSLVPSGMHVGESTFSWQPELQSVEQMYADDLGQIRIETPDPIMTMTVIDSTGCAKLTANELAALKDNVIRIGAWARIEGRADISQPAQGRLQVSARSVNTEWFIGQPQPHTDVRPDGSFVLERLLPGTYQISLSLVKSDGQTISESRLDPPVPPVTVEAIAAQVATVHIVRNLESDPEPGAPGLKPAELAKSSDSRIGANSAKSVPMNGRVGKFITGLVLKPDGTPADQALIGYFNSKESPVPQYQVHFSENRLVGMSVIRSLDEPPVKADLIQADLHGNFRIPADISEVGWVVMHPSGGFRSHEAAPVGPDPVTIRLEPFVNVKGVFEVGGKPQVNAPVWYDGSGRFESLPGKDKVFTDNHGRFELPSLIPGKLRLAFPGKVFEGEYWELLTGQIDVPGGRPVRIETSVDDFGYEQVVFADSKEISRSGSGPYSKEFAVYGLATDAITGKPLEKAKAYLVTGQPKDPANLNVQLNGIHKPQFVAYSLVSDKNIEMTSKIDPFLVVFSPGYEPFVSNQPIPRGKSPIRMDVALKPRPATEMVTKIFEGQVLKSDGNPAVRVNIVFTRRMPELRIGNTNLRWNISTMQGTEDPDAPGRLQTDEDGRFRIESTLPIDQLTITSGSGCAVVSAETLASQPGHIVRLAPWARLEGKVAVSFPEQGEIRVHTSYRDIAWLSHEEAPTARVQPDGTFVIDRVLPGSHLLSLMWHRRTSFDSSRASMLNTPVTPLQFEAVANRTTVVSIGSNSKTSPATEIRQPQ